MIARLTQLGDLMRPSEVKIEKTGRIVEQTPGALRKASGQ
jgi:hypothetical protein